jgi:tRNA(Ile)-lysidine synthase
VAVSGGPDSIALLYLLSTFINKSDINLLSITIDHKLRPASTQEAKNVAQFSESLGKFLIDIWSAE